MKLIAKFRSLKTESKKVKPKLEHSLEKQWVFFFDQKNRQFYGIKTHNLYLEDLCYEDKFKGSY